MEFAPGSDVRGWRTLRALVATEDNRGNTEHVTVREFIHLAVMAPAIRLG